ncbi:HAD-IG family 5'-nucleotidase, partial [Bacteriovoracaceae bacterium]|nr:HAD-IG family 5'-nucleotidase [Bacteriovoracaceae bacterium]
MSVFVNRVINLKKIKALGFDMDYTIVRYNSQAFEELTHQTTIKKLVELKGYPQEVLNFKFDYQRSLQGLVIDKKRGNLLKISRFGKVKFAYYGLEPLGFDKMTNTYRNRVIDLSINQFLSLDTAFSISNGVLFGQLVELKKKNTSLPDYETLADDIKEMIDVAHSDGSLKDQVKKNIKKFIIQDPNIAPLLENYKRHGKKLLVITNSDYTYSKLLLDYAINPFLKEHKHWSELFDITITLSKKPSFFTHKSGFLAINPKDGTMTNHEGPVTNGIYQGGFAGQLQEDLGLEGDEILYLGDHIYGDVVSLKKTFNWRTALVLDPLAD